MKDGYDLFGSLPDTIEDDWIENIELLDEHLCQFRRRKRRANAFDLRYGGTVMPEGPGWELYEGVLSQRTWLNVRQWGGSEPAKPKSLDELLNRHSQLDPVIRCMHQILLGPQISFRGLDGNVTKKELDLLQLAARCSAQLRAGTA